MLSMGVISSTLGPRYWGSGKGKGRDGSETAVQMNIESQVLLLESLEKMAPAHTGFLVQFKKEMTLVVFPFIVTSQGLFLVALIVPPTPVLIFYRF